ncbi:MAG: hypothetical protein ABIW57_07325, partial [Polyangia bacterium]
MTTEMDGVLQEWLAPLDVSTFLRENLQKAPHAGAGTAARALPLLTWDILDGVLKSPLPIDVVTVAGGQLVKASPPRSLAEVRRLMA